MCESRRHDSLIPESKTWRWKSWVRIVKLRLVSLWFQWQVIFPEKYSYFFSFNFILVLKMFSSLHFIKESHQTLAWYRISSSVKLNCCNISPKCQWEIQEFILKNQTVSGWGFMMHVKIVVVRGAATPWIVRLRLRLDPSTSPCLLRLCSPCNQPMLPFRFHPSTPRQLKRAVSIKRWTNCPQAGKFDTISFGP